MQVHCRLLSRMYQKEIQLWRRWGVFSLGGPARCPGWEVVRGGCLGGAGLDDYIEAAGRIDGGLDGTGVDAARGAAGTVIDFEAGVR